MTSSDPIVVVGGGLAAGTCVTELREQGHDGPVVVLTAESHLPYERPPLSKGYLLGNDDADAALVHDAAWYDEHDVEVRTGTRVTALDPGDRTLQAAPAAGGDTRTVRWSSLLLATGAAPRRLALADDSGVPTTYLRTLDDSTELQSHLVPGRRIGIIGGGWIGLEVAAAARTRGADVVLLESFEQPLLRVLGPEVGEVFARLHRDHDVDLRLGVQLRSVSAEGDGATLALADGEDVTVDHLVVGVGVAPVTDLAEAAGLAVDNGIRTDAGLRTSAEGVWAAGDVANADHPVLGRPVRTEHWDTAIQHGKVAAANLAGGSAVAEALPYFFTDQYDLGMEYVGSPGPEGWDRVVVDGDVSSTSELTFKAWWLRGDLVVAGMHVNDWDAIDRVRELVGQRVSDSDLRA